LIALPALATAFLLNACCCPSEEESADSTEPTVTTEEPTNEGGFAHEPEEADEIPTDGDPEIPDGLEPGPCPQGTMCEDGCNCTCIVDGAGLVLRKETDKKRDGSIDAVESRTYDSHGWVLRSEEDGGIWDKKARVDGTADIVWVYTYDTQGNRLTHEVFDAKGKLTKTCRYKTCPPPHNSDICYKALKCK